MKQVILSLFCITLLSNCQEEAPRSDAYGNFESTSTTVSTEANGQLLFLKAEEGKVLKAGQLVALVDTTQLHLQRRQVQASINTLPQKVRTAIDEVEVMKNQQANLVRERDRVKRLFDKKAATSKQLDDLNGQIDVVEKQIDAIQTQVQTTNRGILAEKEPLVASIALINERIRKSYVYNPIDGTVLNKLAEPYEIVGMGSPLYRISQLDTMTLRFYATSTQLEMVSIGESIQVLVDDGQEGYRELNGIISWISEQAEFTPKTVQTKEDRVNLVYAVKAKVENPKGYLKIGMPAEVNFKRSTTSQNQEKSTTLTGESDGG
jgi:HlyD family secretion protein